MEDYTERYDSIQLSSGTHGDCRCVYSYKIQDWQPKLVFINPPLLVMAKLSKLPKVSILTPALNSVRTIEQTIQSVANQDYTNIEHIVVDGGSTDGTLDILFRTPQLLWISEKDDGQSDALNKGYSLANGEILGWLVRRALRLWGIRQVPSP